MAEKLRFAPLGIEGGCPYLQVVQKAVIQGGDPIPSPLAKAQGEPSAPDHIRRRDVEKACPSHYPFSQASPAKKKQADGHKQCHSGLFPAFVIPPMF